MARLKREAHRLYVRFGSTAKWYLIGKYVEDLSVEMNGTFDQKKDITGETHVTDQGYSPQVSVDPYYADPTDEIYESLKDLALNRKSGDDAKAEFMEVLIADDAATSHEAWTENCIIEIASYGGDTTALGISFNIWPDGGRTKGTATYTGKVPTFSESE